MVLMIMFYVCGLLRILLNTMSKHLLIEFTVFKHIHIDKFSLEEFNDIWYSLKLMAISNHECDQDHYFKQVDFCR